MLVLALLSAFLPAAHSHAYLAWPKSRNELQCPPVVVGLYANFCLVTQDASPVTGACKNIPCLGCVKFPPAVVVGGGHHTCTPGNYPGVVPPLEPVCGRPLNLFLVAIGPAFKKGPVQATFQAGSTVEVTTNYLLNHAGNYQFRLCLDGSDTEECFKKTPLKFADGSDWKWIDSKTIFGLVIPTQIKDKIVIPSWAACDKCTLNWRWDTALEASIFSNCADVSISIPSSMKVTTSSGLCLDIPGGDAHDGTALWLWDCNGIGNQDWFFADGSWKIASATHPSLCLDAGDMSQGFEVMLWDCNGMSQQTFGYDSEAKTIYLASSVGDASLCLAGSQQHGGRITVAACDDNNKDQKWYLGAAGSQESLTMPKRSTTFRNQTLV